MQIEKPDSISASSNRQKGNKEYLWHLTGTEENITPNFIALFPPSPVSCRIKYSFPT